MSSYISTQEMSLSFYDVWFPSNDCGKLSIEIQADGYSKMDYRRVGLICDFERLEFVLKHFF